MLNMVLSIMAKNRTKKIVSQTFHVCGLSSFSLLSPRAPGVDEAYQEAAVQAQVEESQVDEEDEVLLD